jgi:hypothetical protein
MVAARRGGPAVCMSLSLACAARPARRSLLARARKWGVTNPRRGNPRRLHPTAPLRSRPLRSRPYPRSSSPTNPALDLRTPAPEQPSIFRRWWFWTAVGPRRRPRWSSSWFPAGATRRRRPILATRSSSHETAPNLCSRWRCCRPRAPAPTIPTPSFPC